MSIFKRMEKNCPCKENSYSTECLAMANGIFYKICCEEDCPFLYWIVEYDKVKVLFQDVKIKQE